MENVGIFHHSRCVSALLVEGHVFFRLGQNFLHVSGIFDTVLHVGIEITVEQIIVAEDIAAVSPLLRLSAVCSIRRQPVQSLILRSDEAYRFLCDGAFDLLIYFVVSCFHSARIGRNGPYLAGVIVCNNFDRIQAQEQRQCNHCIAPQDAFSGLQIEKAHVCPSLGWKKVCRNRSSRFGDTGFAPRSGFPSSTTRSR